METFLNTLERQGAVRAVAYYADDLVILSPGFCLTTVSEQVKEESKWSSIGPRIVNPEKTELVLFAKKVSQKIPRYSTTRFNSILKILKILYKTLKVC